MKNISYKRLLLYSMLLLIMNCLIAFLVINITDYQYHAIENKKAELHNDTVQLVRHLDERLNQLMEYYQIAVDNDDVNWFMNDTVRYSDFSRYTNAKNILWKSQEGIVSGFLLGNFKSGWILTDRALYEVADQSEIQVYLDILESKRDTTAKRFWLYQKEENGEGVNFRESRKKLQMQGLNLILLLPSDTFNEHGELIVNISEQKMLQWMDSWLDGETILLLLDENNAPVFTAEEQLVHECLKLEEKDTSEQPVQIKHPEMKGNYLISRAESSVLSGWNLYLIQREDMFFPLGIVPKFGLSLALFAAIIISISFLAMQLYRPVAKLVRNLVGEDSGNDVSENEFHYIETRIKTLAEDKESLKKTIHQQRIHIEELFLLRLLRGEITEESFHEYLAALELKPGKMYSSAVLSLEGNSDEQNDINDEAVCLRIIQCAPPGMFDRLFLPPVCNLGVIFAIFSGNAEDEIKQNIKSLFEDMKNYIHKQFGMNVVMGVSGFYTEFTHVHHSYRESIHALLVRSNGWQNPQEEAEDLYVFMPEEAAFIEDDQKERTEARCFHDLRIAIETMDLSKSIQISNQFFSEVKEQKNSSDVLIHVLSLVNHILQVCVSNGINFNEVCKVEISQIYSSILNGKSLEWMNHYIQQRLLEPVIDYRKNVVQHSYQQIVQKVYEHISSTKGNTTLYLCADQIGVDSAYIWNSLKISTGKTFSEIVEAYRYGEAQRYLITTNMQINDIAAELGYSNAQNFIRFFNKLAGMSPGKYRRLNSVR